MSPIRCTGVGAQYSLFEDGSVASLSRPLTDAEQAAWGVAQDWGMTPANSFVGTTMRHTSDRRLLIREKVRYRPGMRVTEAERRRAAERHKRLFDARFPVLRDVELAHTWSGFVALTRNAAPGFGRVRGGVHAACCQNGIGVTKGTIAGILAADLACGRDNPLLADIEALGKPAPLPPAPASGRVSPGSCGGGGPKHDCPARAPTSPFPNVPPRQIIYKGQWHHCAVSLAHRFYPSSKTCSNCGYVNAKLKRQRFWQCPSCTINHDRNENAAVNLRELLTLRADSGAMLRDGTALAVGPTDGETSPVDRRTATLGLRPAHP